jgi:glycosyltransferase involved in cell wall biosynthesis
MLVPSRSESLPYIVLEAAGAGIPLIATAVGGVPEIFGPQADRLVPPENPAALGAAIANALDYPEAMRDTAAILRERVKNAFSVDSMVDRVLLSYQEALAA